MLLLCRESPTFAVKTMVSTPVAHPNIPTYRHMIKNIIFDLGGVVIRLDKAEAIRRFKHLGVSDADKRMGLYGQTGPFLAVENGSITADQFCIELAKIASRPTISMEEAKWAWMGFVKEVPQERLDNLLRLKEMYNVILLSNTNPFIQSWARTDAFSADGHSIEYYFHHLYYSYQMHDYKPSLTIFETVLRECGIKAEESIFLDDGQANIDACEQVGIRGLLVPEDEDWMPALAKCLEE